MKVKSAMIVVFLLAARIARSSVISSPNNGFGNTSIGARQSSSTVHNATIDCGDQHVQNHIVQQCQRDLKHLASYGYPWSAEHSQRNSRYNPYATERKSALRDALDSLDHACYTHDQSQRCLEKSKVQDYCLARTSLDGMSINTDFQFICHHQQRDENLVYSLQCLQNNRLLAMLYFHIADRCRGMGLLDGIMRQYKNSVFYTWDIKPVWDHAKTLLSLYCIPRSVISTCIRGLVEDHCGTTTANLIQRVGLPSGLAWPSSAICRTRF